jgi:hypothetical protein
MPVILTKSDSVFLHPMKTGGTWVRMALANAGVAWRDLGRQHAPYLDASEFVLAASCAFTCVRNPFDWYKSFYCFRKSNGWGGNLAIGHACKRRSFSEFVKAVAGDCPGFLTEYFSRFTRGSQYVMRTETLGRDLTDVLSELRERFDVCRLRDTIPVNRSASLPEHGHIRYDETTADLIAESEAQLLTTYGYYWSGQ